MKILFLLLACFIGCKLEVPQYRPVEVSVLTENESQLIVTETKLYFVIRKEDLKGKEITNNITEKDLIEMGLLKPQPLLLK
jgi:hypothetical protein